MSKDDKKDKSDDEIEQYVPAEDSAPQEPEESTAVEEPADQEASAPDTSATPAAAAPAVAPQAAPQPAAPAASYQGSLGALPIPPVSTPQTPEQESAQLLQDNMQFGDEAKSGAIHPKSYHDLYADKGTLGKIGTIFGLMLSGAGSGLTHQPNALLGMMDKEIERDFEAQKAKKANQLSWYSASLLHQRQDPEIQFQLFKNMKAGVPGAAEKLAAASGINNSRGGVVGDIQQNVINKMPEGPQKIAAQNLLDTQIAPYMMKQAANTTQNAVGETNVLAAVNQKKATPSKVTGAVDQDKMNTMMQKAKDNAYLGLGNGRDAIPYGEQASVKNEAANVTANRVLAADYDKTFKRLQAIKNAGQSPGAQIAAKTAGGVGAFLGSIAGAFGGRNPASTIAGGTIGENVGSATGDAFRDYFERERNTEIGLMARRMGVSEAELNRIFPGWQDNDKSMAAAYNSGIDKFRTSDAETKTPGLTQYELKTPFPNFKYQAPKVEKPKEEKKSSEGPKKIPHMNQFYLQPGQKNPFE